MHKIAADQRRAHSQTMAEQRETLGLAQACEAFGETKPIAANPRRIQALAGAAAAPSGDDGAWRRRQVARAKPRARQVAITPISAAQSDPTGAKSRRASVCCNWRPRARSWSDCTRPIGKRRRSRLGHARARPGCSAAAEQLHCGPFPAEAEGKSRREVQAARLLAGSEVAAAFQQSGSISASISSTETALR